MSWFNISVFTGILKDLGFPTLIGVLIGGWLSQIESEKRNIVEEKRHKRSVAEKIIGGLYKYDVDVSNLLMQRKFDQKEKRLIELTEKTLIAHSQVAEIRGIAKLYIGSDIEKEIEEFIQLIRNDVDETHKRINEGSFKGGRLQTREKCRKKLKLITKKILQWIEKN